MYLATASWKTSASKLKLKRFPISGRLVNRGPGGMSLNWYNSNSWYIINANSSAISIFPRLTYSVTIAIFANSVSRGGGICYAPIHTERRIGPNPLLDHESWAYKQRRDLGKSLPGATRSTTGHPIKNNENERVKSSYGVEFEHWFTCIYRRLILYKRL